MSNLFQSWKNILDRFFKVFQKKKVNKNIYIIYKIVDSYFINQIEYYKIQCINTKAIVQLTLEEIVCDFTFLHGLHPIQGCFVGIEYSKAFQRIGRSPHYSIKLQCILNKNCPNRYGNNNLEYQDRSGRLGFRHGSTSENFLMDPRDIALSQELIEEFDAVQAFYIGFLAGLKFVNTVARQSNLHTIKKVAHLRLVE